MSGYVDIHAHVLYGIDDGPPDRADSEAMLRTAAHAGTRTIAATPHLRSDFPDVHVHELAARCDELREWIAAEGLEIELVNGGEVGLVWALDASEDDLRLASYGQRGTDLLIETPTTTVGIEALLYQVRTHGYRVTLAHPERSREFQRNPALLEALVAARDHAAGQRRRPARPIRASRRRARWPTSCVLDGLVHALASDSHRAGEWRPVSVIPEAAAAASELVGPERAQWMLADAPAAIVAGPPLPEPPPIVARRRRRGCGRAADRPAERIHATMVNVFDTGFEYDDEDPDGYRSGQAWVGREAGGSARNGQAVRDPAGPGLLPVSLRVRGGVAARGRRHAGCARPTASARSRRRPGLLPGRPRRRPQALQPGRRHQPA